MYRPHWTIGQGESLLRIPWTRGEEGAKGGGSDGEETWWVDGYWFAW